MLLGLLLGPSLIGSAVCNFARMTCLEVEDPAPVRVLAHEGDLRPIGRPCRHVVFPALGRVGDLADMTSVWVHREDSGLGLIGIEPAAKGDLTVSGSSATALALVVLLATAATGAQCQRNCANHKHRNQHGDHQYKPASHNASPFPVGE